MADVGISVQLQGLEAVTQGLGSVAASAQRLAVDTKVAAASTGSLGAAFANIKSIVAGLGLVAIFGEAKNYIDKTLISMENIGRTSKALGVSAQDLQKWQFAAERMGSSGESVNSALKFLNRTLGDMTIGIMTPAAKMLGQLGVNLDAVKKGSISTGDAFKIAVQGLQRIPDSATRTAVALQVFGRGAEDLLRAMNDPAQWNYLMRHFEEMGLGITNNVAERMASAQSGFKDLGATVQDFANKAIVGAILAFDDLGTAIKDSGFELKDFGQDLDHFQKNHPKGGKGWFDFSGNFGQGNTDLSNTYSDAKYVSARSGSSSQIGSGLGDLGGSIIKTLYVDMSKGDVAAKKYADTIADLNAKIDETTKAIDEGNYAMLIDQELKKAGIPLTGKLTATQEEEKSAIEELTHKYADTKEAIKEMAVASAEWNKESQQAQRLVDQLRTPLEKHADEMARLTQLYEEGHLSLEKYTQGVKDLAKQEANADPIAKSFGDAIGNSIEGAILHGGKISNIFKDLGKQLAQTLVHELITKNISEAIAGALHGKDGGNFLGGIGGAISSALGKILGADSPFLSKLHDILQSAWNALPDILGHAWDLLKSILGGFGGSGGGGSGLLGLIGDGLSLLGFAGGGDLTVTRPQLVMVGERGPERLSVRPMAGGHHGDNGYGGGIHIHLPPSSVLSNITAPTYARMVARAVARENRRRV